MAGQHTPRTGAFAGITFSSYRQYLNAKERAASGRSFAQAASERRAKRIAAYPGNREFRDENRERLLNGFVRQQVGLANERNRQRIIPIRLRTVGEMLQRQSRPGSTFNRLWRKAEAEGFNPVADGAWDKLLHAAGMRGGEDASAHERAKYIALVEWHFEHTGISDDPWMDDRRHGGTFVQPGDYGRRSA